MTESLSGKATTFIATATTKSRNGGGSPLQGLMFGLEEVDGHRQNHGAQWRQSPRQKNEWLQGKVGHVAKGCCSGGRQMSSDGCGGAKH
jgi:hypothetical protein